MTALACARVSFRSPQKEPSSAPAVFFMTVTDERYMKLAEEGLYSELSLVMGKDREEIKEKFLDYCKQ